jgi:hypothetical protein
MWPKLPPLALLLLMLLLLLEGRLHQEATPVCLHAEKKTIGHNYHCKKRLITMITDDHMLQQVPCLGVLRSMLLCIDGGVAL